MSDDNIWVAASDGKLDRVKVLVLEGGVSVNAQDEQGYSALHAACSYGNVETAAWLLQNGGDVGLRDSDGDTPLMVCESAACAALLKGAGADVFAANTAGRTAFHTATLEYREEMVAWLTAEYAAAGVALPAVERDEDDEEDEDGGGDFGDDGEGEDEGEGEGEGGDVAAAPAAAAEPPA